jgi:hypothetical protein
MEPFTVCCEYQIPLLFGLLLMVTVSGWLIGAAACDSALQAGVAFRVAGLSPGSGEMGGGGLPNRQWGDDSLTRSEVTASRRLKNALPCPCMG